MDKETEPLKKRIRTLERELELLKSAESEEEYLKQKSEKRIAYRKQQLQENKNKAMDTIELWGLYGEKDMHQFKSYNLPIFATTAGAPYRSLTEGKLLLSHDITNDPNKVYSRFDNTTIDHLAHKLASMEGKGITEITQGLCTASGMSAIFLATLPFLSAGDNFVASHRIYGGTYQLFEVTYPKMGWNVRWVKDALDPQVWKQKIDEDTKFLYLEFPANPTLLCPPIQEIATVAHDADIPLIVDSTLATPILTRPLEHKADIVVHSMTKIMCGTGRTIGGGIVAKKKITTKNEDLKQDFVKKVKRGSFRNIGPCMSPYSAKEIWDTLNSLKFRIKAVSKKALKIAEYLNDHSKIETVHYPGLDSHPQHEIAKKLMTLPNGKNAYGHLMSFEVKGGLQATKKFARKFNFGVMVGDLGSDYTVWVHPASTTHGQMEKEEREAAGISDNLIRYSVGLESAEEAIDAFETTLRKL